VSDVVKTGDWVVLYYSDKRRYVVKVESGKTFHTMHGSINLSSLVGLEYGCSIETNIGEKLTVSRASFIDRLEVLQKYTQVIYPKDAAYILLTAGIGPGSRVVEAGTGTGYMTAILAWYVKPSGRVFTYEIRKEFYERALKNLKTLEVIQYVEAKNKDVRNGIDEEDVDAVVLDMPDPWNVVEEAMKSLTHGGSIAIFVPTVPQLEKTIISLKKANFKQIEPAEIQLRRFKPIPEELRPETLGVVHTGYVIVARKI
jgi:tRNA (adenine57-N1/adenine58-N1)-methyltransferase